MGNGAGDAAGEVAADEVVAAEGADGDDGGDGGGVGSVVELFELARGGFGREEAAVGWGDEATTDGIKQQGDEGEDFGGGDVAGAQASAIRCTAGVGFNGF